MDALCINWSYSHQGLICKKFGDNCSAFGGGWKTQYFWVGHFDFFFFKFLIFFAWFLWLPWFPENYETYCICYLVWLIKVETIWFPCSKWSFWLEYILIKNVSCLGILIQIQIIERKVIKSLKSVFRLHAAAGSLTRPWGNLWATLLSLH